jgi:hypothetical protein
MFGIIISIITRRVPEYEERVPAGSRNIWNEIIKNLLLNGIYFHLLPNELPELFLLFKCPLLAH